MNAEDESKNLKEKIKREEEKTGRGQGREGGEKVVKRRRGTIGKLGCYTEQQ